MVAGWYAAVEDLAVAVGPDIRSLHRKACTMWHSGTSHLTRDDARTLPSSSVLPTHPPTTPLLTNAHARDARTVHRYRNTRARARAHTQIGLQHAAPPSVCDK